jgi:outer membrane protein assembly factor BamB
MSEAFSQVPPAPPTPEQVTPTLPDEPAPRVRPLAPPERPAARPPRVWPGAVIVVLMWVGMFLPAWLELGMFPMFMARMWGPIAATALLAVWWAFFSRLRWYDRLLGIGAFAAAGAGATALADFPFMVAIVFVLPIAVTAWAGWMTVTPFLAWPVRRVGLLVIILAAWGVFDLIRMDGLNGSFDLGFSWRWSQTAEQKFMADLANRKSAAPTSATALTLGDGDWPGFRGRRRDSRRDGVRVAVDWAKEPPKKLWRQLIGPGWSSFAVVGNRLYTQEQRGDDEAVVCYDADTGGQLWAHTDAARFADASKASGAGPRATPTFHNGKLYALGAVGRLNCLDAATGEVKWSQDIVKDSGAAIPIWGFSSSPLVAKGVVTVFAGGEGKSVLGYDAETGDLKWSGGDGKLSYSSPQLAELADVEQVLMATEKGLTAFDPADGTVLWTHDSPVEVGAGRILQPTVLGKSDVLVAAGVGEGTQRLHVSRKGKEWDVQEVWKSKAISPYFNDQVVHDGFLYGFDGSFLTCVSLEDGQKKWRARGYDNGEVLLLSDQGLLLVLTEKGTVALVEAKPERCKELGRFQPIEDQGKTWNHPVVAHGKLFVRNGEEVACYRLPPDVSAQSAGE